MPQQACPLRTSFPPVAGRHSASAGKIVLVFARDFVSFDLFVEIQIEIAPMRSREHRYSKAGPVDSSSIVPSLSP